MASPSKATRQSAIQVMRRLSFDPLKYIIKQFNGLPDGDPEKMKAAFELLPYAYPKRRPELEDDTPARQIIEVVIGSTGKARKAGKLA